MAAPASRSPATIDEAWPRPALRIRAGVAALAAVVAVAVFAVVSVVWRSGASLRAAAPTAAAARPLSPSPVEVSLVPTPAPRPARPASATGVPN